MQDDFLTGMLTVRENLMFSANLRLPSMMTSDEKTEKVNTILTNLGLLSCADTTVGYMTYKVMIPRKE